MENPQFSKDQQVDTMVIYTNDTIVRIESKSKLGEQVLIKHLVKQKSYLLLNVNDQKFAIQTNADTALTKNTIDQKIKYYWFGSKKISGVKAKKAKISRNDLDTAKIFYYTKTIRPDLLNVYEGVKGLPLHYYLQHTDGIYQYQLVEFSDQAVSRDYSEFLRTTRSRLLMNFSKPSSKNKHQNISLLHCENVVNTSLCI
ncbi:MAG: hypothetical protein KJ941_06270 [Bacteroidetes bacterium]|nr:hypothetical protein [Bacteroidota bacterium]